MIKSITVKNHLGETYPLELTGPERYGLAIKSITGLGPGKANINTSEVTTTDGGLYSSSRLPVRNIVISLEFLWAKTIEEARQRTYRMFPIKRDVTLLIETDNRSVEISGYVESNEPTIFSKNEGTEISIICPDPYFYATGADGVVAEEFYGLTSLFEFEFSNESMTDSLIEMGSLATTSRRTINYRGDVETGVTITLHALGEVKNITINHSTAYTSGSIKIHTDKLKSPIEEGDTIVICTMKGKKSAKLIRAGTEINILNSLDKHVDWFQLVRGDNLFTYMADEGLQNLNMAIESRVRYEGV